MTALENVITCIHRGHKIMDRREVRCGSELLPVFACAVHAENCTVRRWSRKQEECICFRCPDRSNVPGSDF